MRAVAVCAALVCGGCGALVCAGCAALVCAGCAALVCAGCGDAAARAALADVRPVTAGLENVNLDELAVFGGGGTGHGDLVMTEAGGRKLRVPVSLTSGHAGAMMLADNALGTLAVDFEPGDVKDGTDLLGTYQGVEWNVTLLFGVGGFDLENEQFVRLHGLTFAQLFGVDVGHTWLGVDVAGDVVEGK